MSINTIEQDFIDKVSAKVRLSADGEERFRVFTPFMFEDGDQLVIVLKKEGERWILSDEAHTYMHLTYEIDEESLHSGTRQKIISRALSMFEVQDRNGELIIEIQDGGYGDALYSFVQSLLKIIDVSYLSRERVQSTFLEDFRTLMHEKAPEDRTTFDWFNPRRDPKGTYTVDCRVNGMPQPLFVYALSHDSRARDATIALYEFKRWGIPFRSVGIFRNAGATSRKVRERFRAVCDNYFIGIPENYEQIGEFLNENISA